MGRFLTEKLRLKVNEAKSAVARPEERKFLGFSISNDGSERRIASKALDSSRQRIRDLTRRTAGAVCHRADRRARAIPDRLAWLLRLLPDPAGASNLDAWIRRRLRSYLWRQWQNGRNRFKELRRRGVSKFHAAVAAGSPTGFWRMSSAPGGAKALRNHDFDSIGLPRLHVSAQA